MNLKMDINLLLKIIVSLIYDVSLQITALASATFAFYSSPTDRVQQT
jgi:hypothetical protein